MKQDVSMQQFYNLPDEQRIVFNLWMNEKRYTNQYPTIGQMIHFLFDHRPDKRYKGINLPETGSEWEGEVLPEKLCDDCWKAVGGELERIVKQRGGV